MNTASFIHCSAFSFTWLLIYFYLPLHVCEFVGFFFFQLAIKLHASACLLSAYFISIHQLAFFWAICTISVNVESGGKLQNYCISGLHYRPKQRFTRGCRDVQIKPVGILPGVGERQERGSEPVTMDTCPSRCFRISIHNFLIFWWTHKVNYYMIAWWCADAMLMYQRGLCFNTLLYKDHNTQMLSVTLTAAEIWAVNQIWAPDLKGNNSIRGGW